MFRIIRSSEQKQLSLELHSSLVRWSETGHRDRTPQRPKVKGPDPRSAELQHVWDWKKAAVETSSWRWPAVWLPHRSLLPCLQGKQDSARVQCFMSWSEPNSPHSHKHCTEGRDSGHAAAGARPHGVCSVHHNTYTHIYLHICAHYRLGQKCWLTRLSIRTTRYCIACVK